MKTARKSAADVDAIVGKVRGTTLTTPTENDNPWPRGRDARSHTAGQDDFDPDPGSVIPAASRTRTVASCLANFDGWWPRMIGLELDGLRRGCHMSTLRTRRYKCICSGKSVQLKIIKVQRRTVRQLVSVDRLPRWQIAHKTMAPPIFLPFGENRL